MNRYPFGKAALAILLIGAVSGVWLALHRPVHRKATLTVWTFAKQHYEFYQGAAKSFEADHPGVTVDIQLVDLRSLVTRLQAAFLADLDVPDLTEIEISSAGSFFRGPVSDVGFSDLTDRIHKSGLWDRMVQARFAPYTSRGHMFGIPHDVHPVQLAYRRDMFEKLGIDPEKIKTWDDFIAVGRRVTVPGQRYLIELSDSDSSGLETCLFQRGGGYFNPQGDCTMDNDAAVRTMCWYVPLVAGPHAIGNSLGGGQILTKAIEDGYLLCMIAPDWRTKSIEQIMPRMSGKMSLMPFPAVTADGISTSTWGGTMLGITKRCKNQDLAWELAMRMYLDQSQLAERFRGTNILPALREAWTQPAFREPRKFWSDMPLGTSYVKLAPDVPYQYTSAFIVLAKDKMSGALVDCVRRYRESGESGFEPFVRDRLHQAAQQVRARIALNPYR